MMATKTGFLTLRCLVLMLVLLETLVLMLKVASIPVARIGHVTIRSLFVDNLQGVNHATIVAIYSLARARSRGVSSEG